MKSNYTIPLKMALLTLIITLLAVDIAEMTVVHFDQDSLQLSQGIQPVLKPKDGYQFECTNRGHWFNKTYIYDSKSEDCNAFVKTFVSGTRPDSWLFLGDSTMMKLFNQLHPMYSNCTADREALRCDVMEYLNITRRKNWVAPSDTMGPVDYGFENHFCTDCNGCNSIEYKCKNSYIEYVAVEFSKDAEQQSPLTKTTQETVELYLTGKQYDVCVINAGLHDMGPNITSRPTFNITGEDYVQNVKDYLIRLILSCNHMIWISISATRGDKDIEQTNEKILEWNKGVLEMIKGSYPRMAYIDMFPMSNLSSLHADALHLNTTYYGKAASFFKLD